MELAQDPVGCSHVLFLSPHVARAALLTGRLPIRNGFYTTNAHARNGMAPCPSRDVLPEGRLVSWAFRHGRLRARMRSQAGGIGWPWAPVALALPRPDACFCPKVSSRQILEDPQNAVARQGGTWSPTQGLAQALPSQACAPVLSPPGHS